jgi:hypothetical protein
MRRAALPLLAALLLPGLAHAATGANWSKLSGDGSATLYVDKASVARVDSAEGGPEDARKAWTLVSFSKPQTSADGKTYRSLKAQYLYACKDRSVTLLAQTYYPATLARGEAVGTFKYEQYDPEQPAAGSHTETARNYVCRRKLR